VNIAGIQWDAVNAYDGVAVEIYPSGCYRNCKGCHNPQLQDYNYGEPLNSVRLYQELNEGKQWFDIISIIGGDLLCQKPSEAFLFSYELRYEFQDKKLWLFTGADQEEIPKWCFKFFDVIKVGRYMEELRDESYELASTNQKYLRKEVDYD